MGSDEKQRDNPRRYRRVDGQKVCGLAAIAKEKMSVIPIAVSARRLGIYGGLSFCHFFCQLFSRHQVLICAVWYLFAVRMRFSQCLQG